MVKKQRSTWQQSVTQDSNNNQVPETNGVLPTSDQVGLYLASTQQMAPPEHSAHIRLNRPAIHLSISEG